MYHLGVWMSLIGAWTFDATGMVVRRLDRPDYSARGNSITLLLPLVHSYCKPVSL